MKKLLALFLILMFGHQIQAQYTRIRLNQIQKDNNGGSITISSLSDSSMIYSRDFYISQDSFLILFGDTIGRGALSTVLVDSIFIFGDGSTTPIQLDVSKTGDTILNRIAPGLGIDTAYIDGVLTLSSLNIEQVCKNETGRTLLKGYPVYQVACIGQGNAICVDYADASNPAKMPAIGVLEDNLLDGQEGRILFTGFIQNVNTSLFNSGDVVYVAVDSGYTNVKPKGENVLIQNLGRVIKVSANNGSGIIAGAGRSNDVPNLNPNNIFIGGADSVVTRINLYTAITDTVSTLVSDSLINYTSRTELSDSTNAIRTYIPLAISDSLIITRLSGDSLIYYQNGVIIGVDTLSNANGMFQQNFIADGVDSSYVVTDAPLPLNVKDILILQNGLVLDKSYILSLTSSNTVTLNFKPILNDDITVVWFDGGYGTVTGLIQVYTDSLTGIKGTGVFTDQLYIDTSIIVTVAALSDSLSGIISTISTDNTLTGDGSAGDPLKVDTTTIGTKGDLTNYLLTANYIVDSTRLITDSILVYYQNGSEIGRDTISGIGGGSESGGELQIYQQVFTANGTDSTYQFTETTLPSTTDNIIVFHNGLALDKEYISITPPDTIRLSLLPQLDDRVVVFLFTGSGSGGISSVVADSVTILGDGTSEGALRVDTTSIIATKADLTLKMDADFSNVTDTLQVANGGTGATSFTAGRVLFGNGTDSINTSADLFWDNTDKRLGIGTSTPSQTVEINLDNSGVNNRFFIQPVPTTDAQHAFGGINNNLNGYKFSADTVSVFFLIDVFGAKTGLGNIGTGGDYSLMAVTNRNFSAGGNDTFKGGALQISNLNNDSGYGYISFGNEYFNNITPQRVGINTVNPTESLDVNGNARFRSIGSGASVGALHRTSTGVLTTNTSDIRLKTNITPLENTLDKILSINTYTYDWINENDKNDLGMIAQELENIFPRLVFTNPNDGYKGIHYDKLGTILTKAIQEQQTIIETQQTKITTLESTIQQLISRIEALENK